MFVNSQLRNKHHLDILTVNEEGHSPENPGLRLNTGEINTSWVTKFISHLLPSSSPQPFMKI